MSILEYYLMINTVLQLNRFAEKAGVKTRGQLLPALIEKQEIISFELAKLISDKLRKQP